MTEPSNDDPYPGAPATSSAPQSVVNAVRLMFVGAAFAAVGIIVLLTTKSSMRTAIAKKNPSFDAHKLDTTVNALVVVSAVFGVIFVVLYVLLALQVRRGKNWARVVTMVITAFGVLSTLTSFAQPAAAIGHIFSLVAGLLDLAIIVLLVQSRNYFRPVVR